MMRSVIPPSAEQTPIIASRRALLDPLAEVACPSPLEPEPLPEPVPAIGSATALTAKDASTCAAMLAGMPLVAV